MDTHNQQVSAVQALINSLNEDCWRHILEYLTIQELMQTERTCKDWQKLVLHHISYRPIVVQGNEMDENTLILKKSDNWTSFKRWMKKCGHSVQEFDVDCQHYRDAVEVLRDNCPNLKYLSLRRLKQKLPPTNTHHFLKLKWLVFEYCDEVTDDCVSQFLTSNLNELVIIYNKRVTGRFLNNLKSDNMSRLVIRHCRAFKFPFLLSAADRFTNLMVIVFWKKNRSKIEIRSKLHLLLDKLPNLREIGFEIDDMLSSNDLERRLSESNVFFESVCRLKKLQILNANIQVWDHQLEAVASSCKELASLNLIFDDITRRGLDALCRHAGSGLYQLNLSGSLITDDDVVACVYACPNLLFLDLCDCPMLVSALQRIAEARRDMRESMPLSQRTQRFYRLGIPLQLTMSRWDFYGDKNDLKDVINIRFTKLYDGTDDLY